MTRHRVPLDVQQKNILVNVNGEHINVVVADISSLKVEGSTAHLSYMVDAEGSLDSLAMQKDGAPDHFVGVITGDPSQSTFQQIIDSTDAALRLMRAAGAHSAVIPLSKLLAKILKIDEQFLITGALLGLREFTDQLLARDEEPLIEEIIITAATAIYQGWQTDERLDLFSLFGHRPENEAIPLVKSPSMPAPGEEPNLVQRAWLELIGRFLTDSKESHLTVMFDARTGEPFSVIEKVSALDLGGLGVNMGAIDVQYIEVDGRNHILVGNSFAANLENAGTIEPEVTENIRGIGRFSPIFRAPEELAPPRGAGAQPTIRIESSRLPRLGDETREIHHDVDVYVHNELFMQQLVETSFHGQEGGERNALVPFAGDQRIASWLGEIFHDISDISEADVAFHISRRHYGYNEYDIGLNEEGRFIGAAVRRVSEGGADPKPITVGAYENAVAYVRGITFRDFKMGDGTLQKVPISNELDSTVPEATIAFLRWYDSREFREARTNVMIDDRLTEILFPLYGAKVRMAAFLAHLEGDPSLMKRVIGIHRKIAGHDPRSTEALQSFQNILAFFRRRATQDVELEKSGEIAITYIEMLMRAVLGEKAVDSILKKASLLPPKKGGGGAPPPPPSGANRKGGATPPPPPKGALGSTKARAGAEVEKTPPGDPAEIAKRWRTIVAGKIVEVTNGPLKPTTPDDKHIDLIMTFDPTTGEPIGVYNEKFYHMLDPHTFTTPGERVAGIKMEYWQHGLRTRLTVHASEMRSSRPVSDTVGKVIEEFRKPVLKPGKKPDPAPGNRGPARSGPPPTPPHVPSTPIGGGGSTKSAEFGGVIAASPIAESTLDSDDAVHPSFEDKLAAFTMGTANAAVQSAIVFAPAAPVAIL